MAKGKKSDKLDPKEMSPRIVNRRARHDYAIGDKIECGIQLMGSEVKAIRLGRVSLQEGYATVDERRLELWLKQVDIGPYEQAGEFAHEPKRPRKLLAKKHEIKRLAQETTATGVTLVPLAVYFKRGVAKVEIGLASGKKSHDKRQDIKKREMDREMRRAMTRKRI